MKSPFKNAVCAAAMPFLLAACSSPNQPISEGGAPSPASAAEMALMATHDSLMFRTDELMALKGKLAGYHSEAPTPYIHGLTAADNAMMAWMHQYKAPDSTATPAARLAYFEQQQQQLAVVRRMFRSSLDSATKFQAAHPAADTLATPVPAFALRDQAGQPVSNATFAGRAYLADFFFATCPGICPKLQSEMLSVFKLYPTDARLGFLSITIDPAHDSTAVLRDYAQRLGVADANRWHFATLGDRAQTFALANRFLTGVMPDTQSPGGLAHNGTLALIDDRGYIRGAYDGMNAAEVARLKTELPLLLAEIDARKKGVAGR